MSAEDYILVVLGFVLAVSIVFEAVVLGMAFFGADNIECNLLWCTFTTERSSELTRTKTYSVQTINDEVYCTKNGEPINCSSEELYKIQPNIRYGNEWKSGGLR